MRKIWMMIAIAGLSGVVFWGLIHYNILPGLIPYAFGEIHRVGQP